MSDLIVTNPFVDWITATMPEMRYEKFLSRFLKYEITEPIRTAYHHSNAVTYYPSEIRHYFTPHAKESGSIIVLDGSALNNIRREHDNIWANKFVMIMARQAIKFTRFDVATDIMDGGELAWKVAELTDKKQIDFRQRKAHVRREQERKDGVSTYAGRRTSPKMVRIYDKNAETKGINPATRIEFELKDTASHLVCNTLSVSRDPSQIAKFFVGLIQEFSDWENVPEIQALTYGDCSVIEPVKREAQLTKKQWLERQVAPTFLKHASGKDLWNWFQAFIEEQMQT